MAREHEIQRTVFTAEQLRSEPKLPGFFDNGPAHFDEDLFSETLINTVRALGIVCLTSDGIGGITATRSETEERQPNMVGVGTIRETHSEAADIVRAHRHNRIPILDSSPDVSSEGYHITTVDPANPTLVADYIPDPSQTNQALEDSTFRAIDKMRPDDNDDGRIDEILLKDSIRWLGPTVIGASAVGVNDAGQDIFEVNAMSVRFIAKDLRHLTPDEVVQIFPESNQHYGHFDWTPLHMLDHGVKVGNVEELAPRYEQHDRAAMIMACSGGICGRSVVTGLRQSHHLRYIMKLFGEKSVDENILHQQSTDTRRLYRLPIRLDLLNR
jgi:hypothetical protein